MNFYFPNAGHYWNGAKEDERFQADMLCKNDEKDRCVEDCSRFFSNQPVVAEQCKTAVEYAFRDKCFPGDSCVIGPSGPVRLASLRVGDLVWTHDGLAPVVAFLPKEDLTLS